MKIIETPKAGFDTIICGFDIYFGVGMDSLVIFVHDAVDFKIFRKFEFLWYFCIKIGF